MNKLITSLSLALFVLAPIAFAGITIPDAPDGYILDQAEVISEEVEASLEAQLATLEAETSTELVIVTLADLQGYNIEEWGLELGRGWGVGQEEFNNGLVLTVAPSDRQVRIDVGYGLEGAVTDAQTSAILAEVVPNFQAEEYEAGIISITGYLETLARGEEFPLEELDTGSDVNDGAMINIAIISFFIIWFFASWMSQSKSWWLGGIFGGLIGLALMQTILSLGIGLAIGLLVDYILSTYFYKKIKWGKGGHGGFGGGSSGGSSGGFGGGSFGGGGSSSSW